MTKRRSLALLGMTIERQRALLTRLWHPSRRSLMTFATGERQPRRDRLARHLERCSECRHFVGFATRLEKVTATLPAPVPNEELLARALADRAAGARVILPAPVPIAAAPNNQRVQRAIGAVAAVVVAAVLGLWWIGRGDRGAFASANELLLAGLVPKSAEARQVGRATDAVKHRLRPLSVTYQRRFIDSVGGRAIDAGKFDLRVARVDSTKWLLTSAWREIEASHDMNNARTWTESVTVADSTLAPISRVVHVKPYRRWAGININQGFRNDSVVGQMSLDDDPTRRPIAHDLSAHHDHLIVSDALAPVFFMGASLVPGAELDVSFLGWAVVPNDIFLPMHMNIAGSERIKTPVGTFDCWTFVIKVGGETHYHWVRKSDQLGLRTLRRLGDGRMRELILLREETKP